MTPTISDINSVLDSNSRLTEVQKCLQESKSAGQKHEPPTHQIARETYDKKTGKIMAKSRISPHPNCDVSDFHSARLVLDRCSGLFSCGLEVFGMCFEQFCYKHERA
ncbi:hypothetical protein Dimus_028937 [Dionaea muscipula]